jgi:hypothetical protein
MKSVIILCLALVFTVRPALAASGLFPKMPAAPKVYVFDCRKDNPEARTSAWALQGLLNQTSAEVYVIEKEKERHLEQLKDCGRPFELVEPLAGNNSGLRTLFKKYQARVNRMIVYDPNQDWTCYLALMSAAQQGGIPVSESVERFDFGISLAGESRRFPEPVSQANGSLRLGTCQSYARLQQAGRFCRLGSSAAG